MTVPKFGLRAIYLQQRIFLQLKYPITTLWPQYIHSNLERFHCSITATIIVKILDRTRLNADFQLPIYVSIFVMLSPQTFQFILPKGRCFFIFRLSTHSRRKSLFIYKLIAAVIIIASAAPILARSISLCASHTSPWVPRYATQDHLRIFPQRPTQLIHRSSKLTWLNQGKKVSPETFYICDSQEYFSNRIRQ